MLAELLDGFFNVLEAVFVHMEMTALMLNYVKRGISETCNDCSDEPLDKIDFLRLSLS
jgi:hypothetical protein